ncbi:TnsA endonuclease N-terminal domain-containing protein [Formivibrio citricus]|nr:TnsA endonuclease N-terminal domain-containing protein [Formivibrio citricus]
MVAWESLLEKDALLLLELSPGVVSYREQPTVIQYSDGIQVREYYPDFELVLADGSIVHLEVKPSEELAKPKIRSKYEQIAAHYRARQFTFRIITELEIRREPRFSNLELIAYPHSHAWLSLPAHDVLVDFFHGHVRSLRDCDRDLGAASTRRLIANGKLVCDLDQPLTANTPVSLFQGEQNASILL